MRQEYRQGDTAKPLVLDLTDEDGPPDLTGALVYVQIENTSQTTAGNVVRPVDQAVTTLGSNSRPTRARVTVEWEDGDLETLGVFKASIRVTYPDGRQETFPNRDDEALWIVVNSQP